jgi:hypothetical protein
VRDPACRMDFAPRPDAPLNLVGGPVQSLLKSGIDLVDSSWRVGVVWVALVRLVGRAGDRAIRAQPGGLRPGGIRVCQAQLGGPRTAIAMALARWRPRRGPGALPARRTNGRAITSIAFGDFWVSWSETGARADPPAPHAEPQGRPLPFSSRSFGACEVGLKSEAGGADEHMFDMMRRWDSLTIRSARTASRISGDRSPCSRLSRPHRSTVTGP